MSRDIPSYINELRRMQRERDLKSIRERIKETEALEKELKTRLMAIDKTKRKTHPIRLMWLKSRSEFWRLIAVMRRIEKGDPPENVTK